MGMVFSHLDLSGASMQPNTEVQIGNYLVTRISSEEELLHCLRTSKKEKEILAYRISNSLEVLFGIDRTGDVVKMIYHDFAFGRPINPILLNKIREVINDIEID